MATSNLTLQNWFETTLSSAINSTDTTISLNSVPTGTEGYLVIEPDNTSTREIIYFTSKTASAVVCPSAVLGRGQSGTTATSHASGSTVRMTINKGYFDSIKDGTVFPEDTFKPQQIVGSNEFLYDFVASGGVWSGDAYASTRNASMTAMVCYINGRRISISAVTARSFTASKDTYIDVLDNQDGTGTLVYTEVANNAASPALASNSLRIGIIVTGATTIASAASVNQGQEDKVLPIASSVPYAVTDSLGNLICPRDPNRRVLGYRQRLTAKSTASLTAVAVEELAVPVIVPTGRKIKATLFAYAVQNNTAAGYAEIRVYEGATAGALTTMKNQATFRSSAANDTGQQEATAVWTPSSTSLFVNASINAAGLGTAQINASATTPCFLLVELV